MGFHYLQKRTAPYSEQGPYITSEGWDYLSVPVENDEAELSVGAGRGNWGNKLQNGARWVRKGKLAAWSPSRDEWEVEERARKRIKRMLPSSARSPSPPRFPHLRSPSPPLMAPYPAPMTQHLSFTSFVLDPAAQHSFRSGMVSDLERATGGLIEGEATLRRALGRLWEALSDDADDLSKGRTEHVISTTVPKQEDVEGDDSYSQHDDESGDEDGRSTTPQMTSNLHKIFIPTPANGNSTHPIKIPPIYDSTGMNFTNQHDILEKALSTLRELQEDGREYVERLEEIREGLGGVRGQKTSLWTVVRERALKEMQDSEL